MCLLPAFKAYFARYLTANNHTNNILSDCDFICNKNRIIATIKDLCMQQQKLMKSVYKTQLEITLKKQKKQIFQGVEIPNNTKVL